MFLYYCFVIYIFGLKKKVQLIQRCFYGKFYICDTTIITHSTLL